eukprot:3627360-Rhodomonas_salina.4
MSPSSTRVTHARSSFSNSAWKQQRSHAQQFAKQFAGPTHIASSVCKLHSSPKHHACRSHAAHGSICRRGTALGCSMLRPH